MKTLQQMLRELARADVGEFAVATDRLPCIKVGGKYEPVDENAPSTEAILEMLVSVGGSRYVEDLESKPAAWTTRLEGVGSVGVQAVMRDGRVQARFVLIRKASVRAAPSRKSIPALRLPRVKPPPPEVHRPDPTLREESVSEPLLRAAVVKPAAGRSPMVSTPTVPAIPARTAPLHGDRGDRRAARRRARGGRQRSPRRVGSADAASPARGARAARGPHRGGVGGAGHRPHRAGAAAVDARGARLVRLRHRPRGAGALPRQRRAAAHRPQGVLPPHPPGIPTLESLGVPLEIEKATHHHQGLVVVTGPTGHGKTNTLAAIVDIVNRGTTHHVITVEDPVEFVHPRKKAMMSQREVGSHTRSFASALKGSLREDPDVIVVGELRDTETVRMALAASETGHLVLGTMNTPSAAKTIDRLVDLFPPADQQQVRMTLAGGLHLVVSQRLLPAADGSGMVPAVELLPGSIALWAMIRDNKTFQIPSLQQRGKGFGILRLDESLYDLVQAGRITKEAALSVAEQPEELEAVFSGKRPPPGAIAAQPPKPETAGGLLGKAGQLFGKRGP